jgi:hypothetical protein
VLELSVLLRLVVCVCGGGGGGGGGGVCGGIKRSLCAPFTLILLPLAIRLPDLLLPGSNDVGYSDPTVISPVIDGLASEGVKLSACYVWNW